MIIPNDDLVLDQLSDQEKANRLRWTLEAAHAGDVNAQFNLGYWHQCGRMGLAVNGPQASFWYERAALQNDIRARYNLGLLHWWGTIVPLNRTRAFDLFGGILAATPAENGWVPQVHAHIRQLVAVYHQEQLELAAAGVVGAFFNLGCLHRDAAGVFQQDIDQAEAAYLVAAEAGDGDAQYNLGSLYAEAEEYERAQHWYAEALAQGVEGAQECLDAVTALRGDNDRGFRLQPN